MIQIRRANERGHANHGWLDTYHTFSFADYHDPNHMGFSVLRVINEDFIAGGGGFQTHGHRDMEIISYVAKGALEHKDSMGNAGVIRPGEVQRMSAGTGVRHSEFNHSKDEAVHLLQIWILPDQEGRQPGYEQKSFSEKFKDNELTLVAAKNGRNGSVSMNQDVDMYVLKSEAAGHKKFTLHPGRSAWLQVIHGEVIANENKLSKSDGVAISKEEALALSWTPQSEFVLFDLP